MHETAVAVHDGRNAQIKVLLSAAPGMGHVRAVLPYVRSFAKAGWDTTFALSSAYIERMRRSVPCASSGATFLAKGPVVYGSHTTEAMALESFEESERLISDLQPDVIVRDVADRGMLWAAEKHGVLCITVASSADNVMTLHGDREAARWGDLRKKLGLQIDNGELSFSEMTMSLMPREFHAESSEISERVRFYREFDTPSLTEPDPRKIVVSLGTTEHVPYEHVSDLVDRATAGQGLHVTHIVPDALVPGISARTAGDVRGFTDLNPLMREAAVFVSHAGANTVREAAQCGVPLLLFPVFADQPYVAMRCEELRIGITSTQQAAPTQVREALHRLLSSEYQRASRVFANAFCQMPPLASSIADIAALLGELPYRREE